MLYVRAMEGPQQGASAFLSLSRSKEHGRHLCPISSKYYAIAAIDIIPCSDHGLDVYGFWKRLILRIPFKVSLYIWNCFTIVPLDIWIIFSVRDLIYI
jgi:hypothetical protein